MKTKKIEVTEKEVKVLKEALDFQKFNRNLGLKSKSNSEKEKAIDEIYTIEKLEKKLEN